MTVVELYVPIRIESEMNRREHWAARMRRFRGHKAAVDAMFPKSMRRAFAKATAPPYVVTLTRIAPRRLDSDNCASGFKGCRDQLAEILGIDDGNEEMLIFRYRQERGGAKEYAVGIRIEQIGVTR